MCKSTPKAHVSDRKAIKGLISAELLVSVMIKNDFNNEDMLLLFYYRADLMVSMPWGFFISLSICLMMSIGWPSALISSGVK